MFKPLGLFATSPCPDPSCKRPRCIFAHGKGLQSLSASGLPPSDSILKRKSATSGYPTVKRKAEAPVPARREVEVPSGVREAVPKRQETTELAAEKVPSTVNKDTSRPVEIPTPRPPDPPSSGSSRPPSIPTNLKNSPQPWVDRQKGLSTLFTQFSKLVSHHSLLVGLTADFATKYSTILPDSGNLAHRCALEQEAEISTNSSSLKAYKSAIHHAAVSISRRPKPDHITHPSVGTLRESRVAIEAAEKRKAGRLTRERVERYCLPVSDFPIWRYPDPTDTSLTFGGGEEPSAEGTTQTCSRCKNPFVVSAANLDERFGECKFHYGKTAPERIEGRRKWIYSCCGRENGEAGCEDGVHVFRDGEVDEALARRVGFRNVTQARGEEGKDGVDIVGMDCEMIYTTAGSSLARVTIVDEDGVVLLDELVRQTVPILDVNTRFSGVHLGELDSAMMDLVAVRAAACAFIGPDTIIVGHGLENDLRALRLIHDNVVDTAVVFPHDKGPPFRRALRDIVKEKLGYFIQDRTADLGHSSAVDARATLDALKWKVRDDAV